jgi:hypothetical protein
MGSCKPSKNPLDGFKKRRLFDEKKYLLSDRGFAFPLHGSFLCRGPDGGRAD